MPYHVLELDDGEYGALLKLFTDHDIIADYESSLGRVLSKLHRDKSSAVAALQQIAAGADHPSEVARAALLLLGQDA